MAITGQIVITRCNLLSNVNVVLSSSLHRCLINIWLIKLSSLDVIFDAPSVLLHLRQGETPKLTLDNILLVIILIIIIMLVIIIIIVRLLTMMIFCLTPTGLRLSLSVK